VEEDGCDGDDDNNEVMKEWHDDTENKRYLRNKPSKIEW
jgi:hypothetical protein